MIKPEHNLSTLTAYPVTLILVGHNANSNCILYVRYKWTVSVTLISTCSLISD
jgi:hypothetical protein